MLETLLQFILKLLPRPLKAIWDKNENIWRYCYYGAWTTVVSMLTKLLGSWAFELAGVSTAENAVANAAITTISWIITVSFAFVVNKKYVFHSETTAANDLVHEIGTFFGARLVSFALELGLMELPVMFSWGKPGYYIMTVVSQFIILAINYVFSKLVVFKKGSEKAGSTQA